ncbi:MAG: alpha-hydroxy-acid oxidizing protein [Spirochaetota bacterium]
MPAGKAKRTVALLGAGYLQQPFIREAKELGLRVIALDQNAHAYAMHDADEFMQVQIADAEAVIAALSPLRDQLGFVTTVATDFSHVVGRVNDALDLPGLNTQQGIVLTHKGKMRDFCAAHGHAHPAYFYGKSKEDMVAWVKSNPNTAGFVIKPVQNMGARGVMFIRGVDDLSYAHEFAASQDKLGEAIIEHYVPAREISVDALCMQGKVFLTGVADRLIEIKDGHFFIENGHTLPGNFSPAQYAAILAALQRYADSLSALSEKPYHGALKGDLRLTDDGRVVIGEIAGRLSGGFMSTHTYPAAHRRSLMQIFARLMLGALEQPLTLEESVATQGVAIERSLYAEPGLLSGLPDEQQLTALRAEFAPEGLKELRCNYRNGELVENLQNNIGKVFHSVIHAATLAEAEEVFARLRRRLTFQTKTPPYDQRVMAKVARARFNNDFCWVCKICDGGYCASGVPGMGGRGEMNSFRDNIVALGEYRITPTYTEKPPAGAASLEFDFLRAAKFRFAGPVLSAPITGSVTNMGGSITEYDYALETGHAMKHLNLLPTFGDGAAADKYQVGLHAIEQLGYGMPVFKPRSEQKELMRRIEAAARAGATAWGIDIDGVSFKTMVLKSAATSHKSLAELRELKSASPLPMVVKGIMTQRDAAVAIEAGASAIVVSNHGGRVADGMPGVARVLPLIAPWVREQAPQVQVLADGGVRSGADIFRMLALGAEAVLVGRPIAIMAVGYGRSGVASMLQYWLDDLRSIMQVHGIARLTDIGAQHIAKFI